MTSATATPSRPPRRGLRVALAAVLPPVLLAVLLAVLVALAVDLGPRIADPGPPDARAASHTRDVADSLRTLVATRAADGSWSATEAEANAVLAAARRLVPGSFGVVGIGGDAVTIDLAVGAPLMPAGLWANLHLAVAASEDGFRLAAARIGRLPVPPALAREALRLALDAKLGGGLGTEALASIAAVRLDPPEATVVFDLDADARAAFFERLRDRALDAAGPAAREQVYVHLWHLDKAVDRRALPRDGSVVPYLDRAVRIAARLAAHPGTHPGTDPHEAMRAALYALALYCGDPAFGDQIGVTLNRDMQGRGNGCAGTTLGARDDLKRHFVISAGLQAATASDTAFGVGELKELLDSNAGGSGFSFRDMVADAAGVRFARALLAAPPEEWKPMLARLDGEAAILPAFDDLPEDLTEAEFRARFGDVDSAAYAAMVAEIDARVAALPFYAPAR